MRAIEILKQEHQLILRGLVLARELSSRLRSGQDGLAPAVTRLAEFLRDFADRHHHGKEEDLLFPWMNQMGMPLDAGPLACMLHEHDQGRAYVRDMLRGVEALEAGRRGVATALDGFALLLEQHISKEDTILFEMAERLGDGDPTLLPAYAAAQPDRELVEANARQTIEELEAELEVGTPAAQTIVV